MKKRIRKGLTLMELAISMALSTIVIGGAVVVFLSLNRLSQTETKSYSEISDAKGLIIAVDQVLSSSKNQSIVMDLNDDSPLLFTITETGGLQFEYSFSQKVLSKKNISASPSVSEDFYSIDSEVKVLISSLGSSCYQFTFQYGKDFSSSLYLLKTIN